MCRLVWNLKPSTFWNIQGLSRPVQVLLYFYLYFSSLSGSAPMIHTHVRSGLARLFGARGSNHNDTSWHILNFAWNQIVFWIYFCLTRQFKIYWAQKMQGFSFKIFILSPSPPLFFLAVHGLCHPERPHHSRPHIPQLCPFMLIHLPPNLCTVYMLTASLYGINCMKTRAL